MAIKTFTTGEVLTAADTNTYLANSGLVFVKSQTVGSSVGSVTITNVFSSTYDNYKVIYAGGNLSGNSSISLQFGPTSVSGYNANYYSTLIYINGNPGAIDKAQQANVSSMLWVGGGSADGAYASFDIYNPNLAKWTRVVNGIYQDANAMGFQQGEQQNTGQYTALTLIGGTLTGGTITVYGYRKG